jgi:hypothetical protein
VQLEVDREILRALEDEYSAITRRLDVLEADYLRHAQELLAQKQRNEKAQAKLRRKVE